MHTPVFHSSNPDIPNSDVLEVTCENLHIYFFLSSRLGNASLFRMLSDEREKKNRIYSKDDSLAIFLGNLGNFEVVKRFGRVSEFCDASLKVINNDA